MLYLETPANPTIQCVDLEELTALGKENNLVVAVDNTFATPYLRQPFQYGVDFVFHSTTKVFEWTQHSDRRRIAGKRYRS